MMKFAALVLGSLFALTACGKGGAVALGKYDLDTAALTSAMLGEAKKKPGFDEAKSKPAMEAMAKMMQASLELKAGGAAVMHSSAMGKDVDEPGTWKLDGDRVTVTTKKGDKEDVRDGKVVGDSIQFVMNERGMTLPLIFKLAK